MKRTEWLERRKQMRFEEAYFGWTERRLTQEDEARLLRSTGSDQSSLTDITDNTQENSHKRYAINRLKHRFSYAKTGR